MLRRGCYITLKDLRIIWRNRGAMTQALLLGLVLIFVFSVAKDTGTKISPREASAFFWLSTVFCETFIFNQLYGLEEPTLARHALIISQIPVQAVWLGKALGAMFILVLAQCFFLPAVIIFLNQTLGGNYLLGLCAVIACDAGLCALGSMLGAITCGRFSRQSLPSILLFPLIMPILLAAIDLCAQTLGGTTSSQTAWLGIIFAFDCLFVGTALFLFGFIYGGEN